MFVVPVSRPEAGAWTRLNAPGKPPVVEPELPEIFERSAFGGDVVMAVRHRELPAEGVQFHPESVLTEQGRELLRNFLEQTR